jgi:hypothetical protein
MLPQARYLQGDLAGRQDIVHIAVHDGAARHAGLGGGLLILGDGDAALRLDRLKPQGAIRTAARQQDGDCPVLLDDRQRPEQVIDRHVLSRQRRTRRQPQLAVRQRHVGVGRNEVHVVGLHVHSLAHLANRHLRGLGKNLRQVAFVVRLQMRDIKDGQARVRGNVFQDRRERFESAGGGTDADHRERGPRG